MKKLITIAGILISTIGYNQIVYDHSEYYETVNVGYDTLYKQDGTIRQIGKVSYNSKGERHGEWLIWEENGKSMINMVI